MCSASFGAFSIASQLGSERKLLGMICLSIKLTMPQKFLSIHDQVANLFHFPRNQLSATVYRASRTQAFSTWAEIAAAPLAA